MASPEIEAARKTNAAKREAKRVKRSNAAKNRATGNPKPAAPGSKAPPRGIGSRAFDAVKRGAQRILPGSGGTPPGGTTTPAASTGGIRAAGGNIVRGAVRGAGGLGLAATGAAVAPGLGSRAVDAIDQGLAGANLRFGSEKPTSTFGRVLEGGTEALARNNLITPQTRQFAARMAAGEPSLTAARSGADSIDPAAEQLGATQGISPDQQARLRRSSIINTNPEVAGLGRSNRVFNTGDVVGRAADALTGSDSATEDTALGAFTGGVVRGVSNLFAPNQAAQPPAPAPAPVDPNAERAARIQSTVNEQTRGLGTGPVGRTGEFIGRTTDPETGKIVDSGVARFNRGFNPLDFDKGAGFIRRGSDGNITVLNTKPQKVQRQSGGGAVAPRTPSNVPNYRVDREGARRGARGAIHPLNFAAPTILAGTNRLQRNQDAAANAGPSLTAGEGRFQTAKNQADKLRLDTQKADEQRGVNDYNEIKETEKGLLSENEDVRNAAKDNLLTLASLGKNPLARDMVAAEAFSELQGQNANVMGAGFWSQLSRAFGSGLSSDNVDMSQLQNIDFRNDGNIIYTDPDSGGSRPVGHRDEFSDPRMARIMKSLVDKAKKKQKKGSR